MYKAARFKEGTLGEWEIEVHTKEAQRALNALSGQNMSWKAYNKIAEAIIDLDKMAGAYKEGYTIKR